MKETKELNKSKIKINSKDNPTIAPNLEIYYKGLKLEGIQEIIIDTIDDEKYKDDGFHLLKKDIKRNGGK